MPLSRILPYVAILLVGQAVLDAGPAIVAEREGGMGLGSALIGARVTQVAGVVLGATLAGHVVDRWSVRAATLSGAFLYYVGLMATGVAPMGSLGTVMAGLGVAGVGFGAMLTAAFAVAAALDSQKARAGGLVLLLAAPIGTRVVVGAAFAAGPPALLVGAAAVVGLAVIAVRLGGNVPLAAVVPGGRSLATPGRAAVSVASVVVLAVGALLAVAGADPSRLSASLFAGPLGLSGLETIDAARAVLLAIGMGLLLLGATGTLAGGGHTVRNAVLGLLLVGFAAAGIAAAVTQATTAGRLPDGTSVLIGASAAVGAGLGLATGWMLLVRGRGPRTPAIIGSTILAATCAIGWVTLLGERPAPGAVSSIVLVGTAAAGLGLAASALRFVLAEVEPHHRGLAAGAGAAAAVIASVLGGMVGGAEALNTLGGESRAVAIGLAGLLVAAAAAVAVAAILPRAERDRPGPTPH